MKLSTRQRMTIAIAFAVFVLVPIIYLSAWSYDSMKYDALVRQVESYLNSNCTQSEVEQFLTKRGVSFTSDREAKTIRAIINGPEWNIVTESNLITITFSDEERVRSVKSQVAYTGP